MTKAEAATASLAYYKWIIFCHCFCLAIDRRQSMAHAKSSGLPSIENLAPASTKGHGLRPDYTKRKYSILQGKYRKPNEVAALL